MHYIIVGYKCNLYIIICQIYITRFNTIKHEISPTGELSRAIVQCFKVFPKDSKELLEIMVTEMELQMRQLQDNIRVYWNVHSSMNGPSLQTVSFSCVGFLCCCLQVYIALYITLYACHVVYYIY